MIPPLLRIGGSGVPLLFAHANGFPPASYRQLLERLIPRFEITSVDHRPLWAGREPPRKLHWNLFADDLILSLETFDAPPWVMGHSMGATVAVLAAARRPGLFSGLVLLDPVFLPRRYVLGTRLMPQRKLRKMPMIRRALSRPERFANHADAFAFYRGKRAFAGLDDEALGDYVHASATQQTEGHLELRYSPAWEAAVYATAPLVRRAVRALDVPTLGLRGCDSDTLRPEMWSRWRHWQPGAVLREVPGGHLFPLENPSETAQAVLENVFAD